MNLNTFPSYYKWRVKTRNGWTYMGDWRITSNVSRSWAATREDKVKFRSPYFKILNRRGKYSKKETKKDSGLEISSINSRTMTS